ncbi:MAG TPA: class I SAM-dependent methyltransferase [Kiritimatiellia bacterium]|nr:class I SAM-dependent methyltransferase [Kiritimatiellia bacterium]HMO98682.1 class I SAM-dependent methyltransferase [Kiritimatiellia bacterium]
MKEEAAIVRPVRRLVDRLFASSFGYRYIRGLFHFGLRLNPIKKALAVEAGDRILDVGCGTGDYAPVVDHPDATYLGIDLDEPYIETARTLHPAPNRTFEVGDLRTIHYPDGAFTKAMILGVMHHITDEENVELLRVLNRIVTDRVVIMDLSPGGWHILNTLLCRFDRGRYPRRLMDQIALIEQVMEVTWSGEYYVRSGVQRYALIVARPRRAALGG